MPRGRTLRGSPTSASQMTKVVSRLPDTSVRESVPTCRQSVGMGSRTDGVSLSTQGVGLLVKPKTSQKQGSGIPMLSTGDDCTPGSKVSKMDKRFDK